VRVVFGLPGVHNLAAWEALRASPIRLIGVRHEQTAVYAADGHARATGEIGVALVTTGPGAANTLGATGEAWASRSPVVVIATDIPAALRRDGVVGGALHEPADQRAMFAPVTKDTIRLDRPEALGEIGAACARALAAPRRPVFVEIPTDALSADAGGGHASRIGSLTAPRAALDLGEAPRRLAAAHRPLVWAGGGALDAGDAVVALAERLGAPIFTTYSARGLGGDHPLSVGLPPHVAQAGELWDAADLLVAVGSDLDGMNTMNWRLRAPPIVAVGIDPADATKNYPAAAVVAADAHAGATALAAALPDARAPWADLPALRDRARTAVRAEHPAELAFLDAFAAAVPRDAIVVADMCIPGYWLAALHAPAAPRRFQYPMGWGTLGYALPAALGAAAAAPGRPVVAVCGDGGILFAVGELAALRQEDLPVTIVVFDDGGYGMLRFDQRRAGVEPYGVDLATPDFAALGQAFALRSEAVDGLGGAFAQRLADHVADPEPTLLHVRLSAALTPPPTVSPRWRLGPEIAPAWRAAVTNPG